MEAHCDERKPGQLGEKDCVVQRSLSQTRSEASDEQRTLWQNVRRYRKVVCVTFGLTSAILLYGYDNVVVGTVSGMPGFQRDFGILLNDEWILPSSWLALWNVSSPIGAMLGSLFGGWFQDRVGRRMSLALCSFVSALAVAVMFVSYIPASADARRALFLVGRFGQGCCIGAAMVATQTYLSEVLPTVLRGSGMALFPVFTLLGQLMGALVIYGSLKKDNGYVVVFGSQWPFSFVPVIVAYFIPESPAWFIRKRKTEEALRAQARLDPPGADTKAIVDRIAANIEHEEATQGQAKFKECFSAANSRRTMIVLWVNSLQAVFGLPLMAKASYFMQIVGLDAKRSLIFLILGIVLGLFANVASIWVLARCGRRKLILSSLSTAAVLWLSMGIANCFHGMGVVWWTGASMMLTIIICGVGVWPASYAVAAETSSLQLRAKTQGMGWAVNAFSIAASGIALPYIFNPDAGNLRGKVGFTYVGTCVLGVLISYLLVPEMKGRTVAEIDRMFDIGLRTRDFRSYRDNSVQQDA
ncbi:MFS general substrate transporter [Paraphaeosphaeria sporulosa]|uniref:MFS general substrate transporter n=1 Tax=Paraphaeosphaeria sporulosa TaxID=1460663 RepID=A0A177BYC4_9PLEO|nr:MFS general substrate transporter [Paraphaeosphaeria sporulosa]OAF99406.1 MFS general substrate transporter [Paraphaeosphaeria sporulosa]